MEYTRKQSWTMRLDLCRTGSEFKSHYQGHLWCYKEHSTCNDPSLHQAEHSLKKRYSSASTFLKIYYIIMDGYLVTRLDFRSVLYRINLFDAKNFSSLKYRIANLVTTKKPSCWQKWLPRKICIKLLPLRYPIDFDDLLDIDLY